MKCRLRYLTIFPVTLNIILILLVLDIMIFKQITDDSSYLTKNDKTSRDFDVNQYYIINNLLDFAYNTSNDSVKETNPKGNQKVILLYNIPKHILSSHWQKSIQLDGLHCNNCAFTRDRNNLLTADAIVFVIGARNERMGLEPPISKELRNPSQVWIFTAFDPPIEHLNTDYESISWNNTMNWSSLYRLDSDIPQPYGTLRSQFNPTNIDYDSIYNVKTKNALWLVRQCQSTSARRQYVTEMINQGFDVDILGVCGIDGKTINTEMLEQIIPTYKFVLGFETSLCDDFITDRFFSNYNYNWIIVARGGADYHRLLPTGTYVDTTDFSDVSTLVYYLNDLGNDREKYINVLQRKNQYKSVIFGPENGMCELCQRLNNLPHFRKSYRNIKDYLNADQCLRPTDL